MGQTDQLSGTWIVVALLLTSLVVMLAKRELNRILSGIDRIPPDLQERLPPKGFMEQMLAAVKRIPSEDFITRALSHFQKSHEHANWLTELEGRLSSVEREVFGQPKYKPWRERHPRRAGEEDLGT